MSRTDYDVVIIGSGAGGGAMAYGLSLRKMRVLVLEAGPRFNPFVDYNLSRADWERSGFPEKSGSQGRYSYGEMQLLDESSDDLRSWNRVSGRTNKTNRRGVFKYHHVRGLGGSTLAYTGEAHRLHPEAMQMGSRFGVAADWPVSYAELEPYYCEVERLIGVAGPAEAGARWRSEPYPLPAHPLSYHSQKLKAGANALGLEWGANARAALSQPYDGRPDCNYCANCSRGCPRTDKGSVDVTFMRKAEASGFCRVRTGVTVVRIERGTGDQVKGLELVNEDGEKEFLLTPQLVVSGGAIETPRLLLVSDGLANESGLVGRNFMETVSWSSTALSAEPLGSFRGLPADSICWDYNSPGSIAGVIGGVRLSTGVHEAGLNGPIAYSKRIFGGWGREHKASMRASFGSVLTVGGVGESLPNAGSYVDLDPDAIDSRGVPIARIHSRLLNTDFERIRFLKKKAGQILEASGATDFVEGYGSADYFSSTHVFGTCRMGADSASSVVDSFGRSHRWKNLHLVDGSLFPSSGGGESPSLTIHALALRATANFTAVA